VQGISHFRLFLGGRRNVRHASAVRELFAFAVRCLSAPDYNAFTPQCSKLGLQHQMLLRACADE
jgi:hypothetical protein